jgi:hypothetical protein
MATLKRYNTFKSLKQCSTAEMERDANVKTNAKAEVEAFFLLLNRSKAQAKKTNSKWKKV